MHETGGHEDMRFKYRGEVRFGTGGRTAQETMESGRNPQRELGRW